MSALSAEDVADARRWALSALSVALFVCGGLAIALYTPADVDQIEPAEPAGAIMVDFGPEAVAPDQEVADLPPGPDQVATEAAPAAVAMPRATDEPPPPDLPTVPDPEVVLPPKPEPTPQEAQQPRVAVPVTSAPQVIADRKAPIAAAPREGIPDPRRSKAIATWRTQILAAIERNKRYPEAARERHQQGITTVSFLLDREGRVSDARIVRGSGATALDDEALAILRRAEPFPAPPTSLNVDRVAINLPIRFATR